MYSKLYALLHYYIKGFITIRVATMLTIYSFGYDFYSSYFVCLKSPNSTVNPTFTFNIVSVVHGKSINKTHCIIFTDTQ